MLPSVITEGAMADEEVVFIKIGIPVDFLDGPTTIRLIYSVEVQVRNRVKFATAITQLYIYFVKKVVINRALCFYRVLLRILLVYFRK